MTLFAGIFNRRRDILVPVDVRDILKRTISRVESDVRSEFGSESCYLVQVNLGHFTGISALSDDGAVTLMNGEPYLGNASVTSDNKNDSALIHSSLCESELATLESSNGVFSVAHYDKEKHEIRLLSDKLGLRPVYYFANDEHVIFASALRIFDELKIVPKRLDVRAMTEIVGLGYALDDRTPYADIKLLRAAESITFSQTGQVHETYFQWDKIAVNPTDIATLRSDLYATFTDSVERRVNGKTAAAAFLSGGLDSRCIAASLKETGARVRTFNFARPGTQDQILGRIFADALGTDHVEIPKQAGDLLPDYSELIAKVLADSVASENEFIVWSGEGGSVALGHVHLTKSIVEKMRAGDITSAINEHLEREFANVSPKMFASGIADRMNGILAEGIAIELAKFDHADAARNFYLHLLLNDQHRKLAKHFENIDLHRVEFELPFFDSSFIRSIMEMPIDPSLRHQLYVEWLEHFPAAVSNVPWQAYPDHVPCPLPQPQGLSYQWADAYQRSERAMKKQQIVEQSRAMLNGDFPDGLLNKRNIRLAGWLHSTGLRDYGYFIGPAYTIFQFLEKCGCNYHLPF